MIIIVSYDDQSHRDDHLISEVGYTVGRLVIIPSGSYCLSLAHCTTLHPAIQCARNCALNSALSNVPYCPLHCTVLHSAMR